MDLTKITIRVALDLDPGLEVWCTDCDRCIHTTWPKTETTTAELVHIIEDHELDHDEPVRVDGQCSCGEAWAGHPNPHSIVCPAY